MLHALRRSLSAGRLLSPAAGHLLATSPPALLRLVPWPAFSSAAAGASDAEQIGVTSLYVAQRIDLAALARQPGVAGRVTAQHRDSLVVSLRPAAAPAPPGGSPAPCAVITGYGSCVFLGVQPAEQEAFLRGVAVAAVKLLPQRHADTFHLAVQPSLPVSSLLEADVLTLRQLDPNYLRVVTAVLAQSVALSHHEAKVDALLELLGGVNAELERSGRMLLPKRELFQRVGEVNSILTDVIAKLGLLSRSDAAWAAARYAEAHAELRADFDIEDRFENLHLKIELLSTTLRFHIDVLQNAKADAMEWAIILLISVEVVLSLFDIATRH